MSRQVPLSLSSRDFCSRNVMISMMTTTQQCRENLEYREVSITLRALLGTVVLGVKAGEG